MGECKWSGEVSYDPASGAPKGVRRDNYHCVAGLSNTNRRRVGNVSQSAARASFGDEDRVRARV